MSRAVVAAGVVIAVAVVAIVGYNVVSRSPSASPDHTFLATAQSTFPAVKASALVSLGHTVCTTFARHPSDPQTAEYDLAEAASAHSEIPPAAMMSLIRAAIHAYCPRYAYVLSEGAQTTTSP
jgi:Protein of unknown function (DUF732)